MLSSSAHLENSELIFALSSAIWSGYDNKRHPASIAYLGDTTLISHYNLKNLPIAKARNISALHPSHHFATF